MGVVLRSLPGHHVQETRRVLTLEDMKNSTNFVAVVDILSFHRLPVESGREVEIAFIGITKSGQKLCLGNFMQEQDRETLLAFARTLKVGVQYEFPEVWRDYVAKRKAP